MLRALMVLTNSSAETLPLPSQSKTSKTSLSLRTVSPLRFFLTYLDGSNALLAGVLDIRYIQYNKTIKSYPINTPLAIKLKIFLIQPINDLDNQHDQLNGLFGYYQMIQKEAAIDLSQYIIRVFTDQCRYRISLMPTQTYADLLNVLEQKTGIQANELQVFTQNGRKLNIRPQKKLKDVVYLRHGSILRLELPKQQHTKTISSPKNISIQNYSPPKEQQRKKIKCKHPSTMKCISCLSKDNNQNKDYAGKGLMAIPSKPQQERQMKCNHGSNMKCLKCLDNNIEKELEVKKSTQIITTPQKLIPPTDNCRHSPSIKCYKCVLSPKKYNNQTLINAQSSLSQNNINTPKKIFSQNPEKSPEKVISPQKTFCLHGESGKCLNCLDVSPQKKMPLQKCTHGPQSKCMHCIEEANKIKVAHVSFDQFLQIQVNNCKNHPKGNQCPSCQPPRNLRLTLKAQCNYHEPYPKGLCNNCLPQNITLKRQEYRHVDYAQFMNNNQLQDFIRFWVEEKKMGEIRVAFIYGYYAEDPFYKNGIRAIVQALYQPNQACSNNRFQLKDPPQKTKNIEKIIDSLKLEKIGMVIASPNSDCFFTEEQVRTIAQMQQDLSVHHSTGYKISNFFTVLVRPNKSELKSIEPLVFMISDQGQALQAASLFVASPNPKKMKLKINENEVLPSIYEAGKAVEEFDIEYLLVNIACGVSKSNRFAILKNNQFPIFNRGRVRKTTLREYILKNFRKPHLAKYGDLNLLLFISEMMNLETAIQLARKVGEEEQIDEGVNILIERKLQQLM